MTFSLARDLDGYCFFQHDYLMVDDREQLNQNQIVVNHGELITVIIHYYSQWINSDHVPMNHDKS